MKKPRCSIAFCPWRAKYFIDDWYNKCWFHHEDFPLINWAWELIAYPIQRMFFWIKSGLCRGWPIRAIVPWTPLRLLLTPQLRYPDDDD